jgi:hypothetical protein
MQLLPLDPSNQEHIDFTYDLLKTRFKHDFINIDHVTLPSIEQHINTIKSDRFKHYYIINYDRLPIGIIYIITKNHELGVFIHGKTSVTAYRKNRQHINALIANYQSGDTQYKKVVLYYVLTAFNLLKQLHPDLKGITARANPINSISNTTLSFIGFKPKHIYYEYD